MQLGFCLPRAEPRVEEAPMEASACATGLAALVRAVERQVLAALQAALSAFFAQARRSGSLASSWRMKYTVLGPGGAVL